ncbi:formate dehydrogenase accessory sulfurtransferase FdhD [Bacillus methanolicus]|uniref:formate dehydrogenase accessory sulfurtransferase FdhD n=1 Tax=Robertmurraya sp. DFI.2.37 TaxID=3031819 RepID=UPI001247DB8F
MKPTATMRKTLRFQNGGIIVKDEAIVTEYPLTIKINGKEWATLVCSPENLEELTIGYLASEGIIKKFEDIDELWIQENEGYAHVKTKRINPFYEKLQNKRYINSCCGASRKSFVFAHDALTSKRVNKFQVKLSIEKVFHLMAKMEESAKVFQQTGGVHNAALCDQNGFILTRMDIGRHNALDKIYGHCMKNKLTIRDKILVFSGRVSSEILIKVAKIGCEIILSKSAPTELAIELAEQLGITTIGFIRGQSLNVYTFPERVLISNYIDKEEFFPNKKSI